MKKIIFVVFLILISSFASAANLASAISSLEQEWASLYYKKQGEKSPAAFEALLSKANVLAKQYPSEVEPMLWQAVIIASSAEHLAPVNALEQVEKARDLLERVVRIAPKGLNGSAHVTLGTLYYMAPSWPLSFGDTARAEQLLTTALQINPNSIEANYFYGDFLMNQNQPEQAAKYFQKALQVPARKHQSLADKSLQEQADSALNHVKDKSFISSKKMFLSLFEGDSK